jgi:hypothetical protein
LGGFTVYVDMEDELIASVYIEVSEDVALSLNKNDSIRFSGDISFANNSLGLTIHLENVTIEVLE